MHIISQPAEDPKPNVGSAMAALLTQVPAQLAEQIRDAWETDLSRVFRIGLAGGRSNALTAMTRYGLVPADGDVPEQSAPSRPKFQVLPGGAL